MRSLDANRLTHLIAPLTRFFYAMLAVTLLAVLLGSPDSALFFLIVAAASHVLRASIQELAYERENAGGQAPTVRRSAPRRQPRPRREPEPRVRPRSARAPRPGAAASR